MKYTFLYSSYLWEFILAIPLISFICPLALCELCPLALCELCPLALGELCPLALGELCPLALCEFYATPVLINDVKRSL